MTTFPPVDTFLPHQPPMVLIDKIISVTNDTIHCQVIIHEANLFFDVERQVVPAYVGIEFMAQSVGAWSGYHGSLANHPPEIGFLLGTRRYQTNGDDFFLGMCLDIYAEKLMQDNGMAVFKASIEYQGQPVAQCQINVYVPSIQTLQQMKSRSQS